jgi:hypothetical protein
MDHHMNQKDRTMRGTRNRITAALTAGVAALGLVTAGASMATAAPSTTATPSAPVATVAVTDNPAGSKYLGTNWDGATLNLNWKGQTYETAEGSFVGTPLTVPGDQAVRTLKVKNNGPSAGTLTVKIINATVTDPQTPTPDVNTDLQNLINVMWNADGQSGAKVFKDLAAAPNGTTQILQEPIAQGATIPVKIGYEFPYDATTGKNLGAPSEILKFDVLLYIQGNTPTPNKTPVIPGPKPSNNLRTYTPSPSASHSATPKSGGPLAHTGAIGLVGAAVLAVVFIVLGVGLKRRRKDEDEAAGAPPVA